MLKERVSYLPDEIVEIAASVLSRRRRIFDYLANLKFDDFQPSGSEFTVTTTSDKYFA